MKKLIIVVVVPILLWGCEKENDRVGITYRLSNAHFDVEVRYRNETEELIEQTVEIEDEHDIWNYTFEADAGDILFFAGTYYDSASSARFQILMDGKVYKEQFSNNEPGQPVIVSGTVPF